MRKTTAGTLTAATLAAAIAVGAGVTDATSAGKGGAAERPVALKATGVDPADFDNPRPNPYFPLTPGLVTRLRGTDEGVRLRERVEITRRTKMIQGVRTTVVKDIIRRTDGTLVEKTFDWYAADNRGNVWYFGEWTASYDEQGRIESRDGTWKAGRDGAVAGLIMPADPKPTDAYRQEFRRGHAEDQGWIVANRGRVKVPAGTFRRVVRSYEWTRLEPDTISMKFYAPGVGIVSEENVVGGSEKLVLVSVRGRR